MAPPATASDIWHHGATERTQKTAMRVLVVEDESDLRDAVVEYLSATGIECRGVGDGKAMRRTLTDFSPDIVLLDINLPGEDGLSLCRFLRRETGAGIIMATARGEPLDRVVGLEIGADDYVTKPYELRELLARVRSLFRRLARTAEPRAADDAASSGPAADLADGPTGEKHILSFGGLRLDTRAHRLLDAGGDEVKLTPSEYDLVRIFAERPNRPLSRTLLSELTHGKDFDPADRTIDIRITRLRKKLEGAAADPRLIRTIRGEGYLFDPEPH